METVDIKVLLTRYYPVLEEYPAFPVLYFSLFLMVDQNKMLYYRVFMHK